MIEIKYFSKSRIKHEHITEWIFIIEVSHLQTMGIHVTCLVCAILQPHTSVLPAAKGLALLTYGIDAIPIPVCVERV